MTTTLESQEGQNPSVSNNLDESTFTDQLRGTINQVLMLAERPSHSHRQAQEVLFTLRPNDRASDRMKIWGTAAMAEYGFRETTGEHLGTRRVGSMALAVDKLYRSDINPNLVFIGSTYYSEEQIAEENWIVVDYSAGRLQWPFCNYQ